VHPIQRSFRLFAGAAHEVRCVGSGASDAALDVGRGRAFHVAFLLEVVPGLEANREHGVLCLAACRVTADDASAGDAELTADGKRELLNEVRANEVREEPVRVHEACEFGPRAGRRTFS